MSKEFGTNWQENDSQRMEEFMLIMTIKNDIINNNNAIRESNLKN